MKNYKQIFFKKNGACRWEKWGAPITLAEFNSRYSDLGAKYFDHEEATHFEAQSWAEAYEILNTTGASRYAGAFKIK